MDAPQFVGDRFALGGQIGLILRDGDLRAEGRPRQIEQAIQNARRPIRRFDEAGHDLGLLGGIFIHHAPIEGALKGLRRS